MLKCNFRWMAWLWDVERYSAGFEGLSAQESKTWWPWVLVTLTVWSFLRRRRAVPLLAGSVCGVDIDWEVRNGGWREEGWKESVLYAEMPG